MKEYYKTLQVDEKATQEEIKKSFKKLALKYHPDKNSGDKSSEEQFKKIQEAYAVLSDPEKRKNYDMFGTADIPKQNPFSQGPFSNPFEEFFGAGFNPFAQQTKQRVKSESIRVFVNLEFEESVNGKQIKLEVNRKEKCAKCNGTGNEGGQTTSCPVCGGTGKIGRGGGFFSISMPCPSCNGSGILNSRSCKHCSGEGHERKKKTIMFNIRPGVKNGDKVIIRGEGHQDQDIPGDIIVNVNVREHKFFQRKDNDIIIHVPITWTQAILGDEIEIPTLQNKVKIIIPKGSENGEILRLKNMGINNGDFYIVLDIKTPKEIDSEVKDLIKRIEELMPSSKSPEPVRPR